MSTETEDFLEHYGVKGMKWGVRKSDVDGVTRKVSREAGKDAKEYARAQMFFGEGAGTRRKLIKATVAQKSKRDPSYKKAFDQHLGSQNMDKHVSKAKSERRRKDITSKSGKTARGVHRQLSGGGGFGNVSLASAAIAATYVGARATGVDKIIIGSAKQKMSSVQKDRAGKRDTQDWLKKNGFM